MFLTVIGCGIESSDKATKRCRMHRQQETEQTRLDYELRPPLPHYPLPSLNRSDKEVYMILKRDALDNHWIDLYNSTIWRNLGLYLVFKSITNNTEFEAEGEYAKTYNFFVKSQLYNVAPVSAKYNLKYRFLYTCFINNALIHFFQCHLQRFQPFLKENREYFLALKALARASKALKVAFPAF